MSRVKPFAMSTQELLRQMAQAVEDSEQVFEDYDTGKKSSVVSGTKLKTALMKMAIDLEREWIES